MNADLRVGEKVTQWAPDGSGVRVDTNRNTYYAQCLILSTGPWIADLLPQLKTVCQVERQVVGWYDSKPAETFTSARMPTFVAALENGIDSYGVPAHETQGMKLARMNHREEIVDPASVNRFVNEEDLSVLKQELKFLFQSEQHRLTDTSVCLFTNVPDKHFILDRHPVFEQVFVCSPCSGMGFKFSSAIGQILSSMVREEVDDDTSQLLQHFSLHRSALQDLEVFE